jgi:hypothetical protein
MDALLRPHTSEPAISREALPCAVRRAMLSFCEAALPNICEKSCQIFLTIGSKSVTIINHAWYTPSEGEEVRDSGELRREAIRRRCGVPDSDTVRR